MTLKFRAWLVDEKRMLHDGEIHSILLDGGKPFMLHVGYFDNGKPIDKYVYIGCRCVLMQAVWKDINEKEVFEGDIVKGIDYSTMQPYTIEKVEYWDDSGVCSCHDLEDIVVLGNIYENPELLKEKQ